MKERASVLGLLLALLSCKQVIRPYLDPDIDAGGGGGGGSVDGGGGAGGGSSQCEPFSVEPCYSGPPETQGKGTCVPGSRSCNAEGTGYGDCIGEVLPSSETCDMKDNDCDGLNDDDLTVTPCAVNLIDYVAAIINKVNTIENFDERTEDDKVPCPQDTGVGEQILNVFSFVGPLSTTCNRMIKDDCNDPQRHNYWVSVWDDRRPRPTGEPGPNRYQFGLIWGDGGPASYPYYGACSPNPDKFDNDAARIPRLLQPVMDANGDGEVSGCAQNHVYSVSFFVLNESGEKEYIPKYNIKSISKPFLVDQSTDASCMSGDSLSNQKSSICVGVSITQKDPLDHTIIAFVDNNYDGTPYVKWKEEEAACAGP